LGQVAVGDARSHAKPGCKSLKIAFRHAVFLGLPSIRALVPGVLT